MMEEGKGSGLLSFAEVEERLVEAIRVTWRAPDRERAWLTVRAYWPDIHRHTALGDYDERGGDGVSSDVKLRPAALTRAEVADAEEALGWLDAVPVEDRKLIGLAIVALAGGARQVPWSRLLRPMGKARGVDGLRRRYERALGAVCRRVNGGFPLPPHVKPENRAVG